MKNLLSLFVMLFVGISLYAQDVIVKRDGTTIMAKVLSVGTTSVEYKKWSNQDGPTYTIEKSELLSINYANGEKDVFEEQNAKVTPTPVVTSPTYTQDDISYAVSKAVSQTAYKTTAGRGKIIGGALLIALVGAPLVGTWIPLMINDSPAGITWATGIVGVLTVGGGIALISSGKRDKEDALYSHKSPILQYDFKVGDYTLTPSIDVYNNRMTKQKGIGAGLAFRF